MRADQMFKKTLNYGISSEMSGMDQKYVRMTNIVNLLFIFALSIPLCVLVILLSDDGIKSYSRYILLILFSFINILLNVYHKNLLSKISTSISPLFCLVVFPIFINHFIHPGMFLWLPYGIMIIGTIPFFIFSYEKEKTIMVFVIAFYFMAILFFDEIVILLFDKIIDLSFIKKYYLYYMLAKIFISLFLYNVFFIFKFTYYKIRMELHSLSQQLNEKNQKLITLNSGLEAIVDDRTRKLKLQNQRIKNLAFTNAHEIRAYLARIIGLINIMDCGITQDEKEDCEVKIRENAIELNNLTIKISNDLIEENE